VFSIFNYGFRPNVSAHNALQIVKSWSNSIDWLIKHDVNTIFNKINYYKLKNIFFKYCPSFQI
jgi:retron-type reverse transcriptase